MLQPVTGGLRPDADCPHRFIVETIFTPDGELSSLERLVNCSFATICAVVVLCGDILSSQRICKRSSTFHHLCTLGKYGTHMQWMLRLLLGRLVTFYWPLTFVTLMSLDILNNYTECECDRSSSVVLTQFSILKLLTCVWPCSTYLGKLPAFAAIYAHDRPTIVELTYLPPIQPTPAWNMLSGFSTQFHAFWVYCFDEHVNCMYFGCQQTDSNSGVATMVQVLPPDRQGWLIQFVQIRWFFFARGEGGWPLKCNWARFNTCMLLALLYCF